MPPPEGSSTAWHAGQRHSSKRPARVHRVARFVAAVWREADGFARVHFIGFTCLWPLLGLGSTNSTIAPGTAAVVVLVGVCFHLFGFLLNDVVDLPIDLTQPRRANDPLVRGVVSTKAVLTLAIVQVPLAFLVAWRSGADGAALLALAAAFACMAAYDLFGKRATNPLVTDFVLGLSGCAFVIFGALVGGQELSTVSVLTGAYAAAYFFLFNGIHGGMRDMQNDDACGARTTGLHLGIRFSNGTLHIPRRASAFCWALQVLLILIACVIALIPDYDDGTRTAMLVVSLGAGIVNALLMHIVLSPDHPRWEEAYRLHLLTLVLALIAVLAPMMGARLTVFVLVLFVAPMTMIERVPHIVRWLLPWRRADS